MSSEPRTQPASDEFSRAEQAAQFILAKTKLRPKVAVVLGSGLGAFAHELGDVTRVPYQEIPSFPRSTAIGHAGVLAIGKCESVPVAAMSGRVHMYEGYSAQEVAFPMRVLGRMGIKAAILTNAAGGINLEYKQGCLVLLSDHINLQGRNPLVGQNDERFGPRFPDMTRAHHKPYRQIAMEEARRLGLICFEGVYAALLGPNYETPAEIRFLRTIGADVVGMSTVAEVIVARHCGMKVLAISVVTNMAAGILDQPIHHAEVLQTGQRIRGQFAALLAALITQLAIS